MFVFDTFDRTPLSYLLGIWMVQEMPFLAAMPTHVHHWSLFVKPKELADVLSNFHMKLQEVRPLDPRLNFQAVVSMLSGNYGKLQFSVGARGAGVTASYVGYAQKAPNPN